MDIENFETYKAYNEKGLKKPATASLHKFIASFLGDSERQDWVWSYLATLEKNNHCRIRHEIFTELVYPVLKQGYLNQDFDATFWLGQLTQNIYQNKALHEELDFITEYQLYLKCYQLKPNSVEVISVLLKVMVQQLEYALHEYPSAILWDNNSANLAQCEELAKELAFARKLDGESKYNLFFNDVEDKLSTYSARLNH